MLTIRNIGDFKNMLCRGTRATDVITKSGYYGFQFEVSEFPKRVGNKLGGMGVRNLLVWLERIPTYHEVHGDRVYRLWVSDFQSKTAIWVDSYDLEQPYRLAGKVTDVLDELVKIC